MSQATQSTHEKELKNINKNSSLNDIMSAISDGEPSRKIPPLDAWQPTAVHDFDIIIKDNGEWYHEGVKMTRQSLVDLFASVLWGQDEDGRQAYFLKTPHDLYRIQVADVPLFVNTVDEVEQDGRTWIVFGTTNGDRIVLDDKPLYFKEFIKDGRAEQRLYIDTRFGLSARIGANVLYHLIEMGELGEMGDKTVLTLMSGGRVHQVETQHD